ncbi:MAG: hypothetical protein BWY63_01266 [Chloroflexi bacterium ADurb.Bin360]|nr:MAG: hypothetical protein BWY63_01266 [Chloroflexi bacterium ADurb.Bin360]
MGIDGAVGVAPVNREAQARPERAVIRLGALAHRQAASDEGFPSHVGDADTLPLLHQALSGQAVVIEAHGVEDIVAVHAEEARHEVGVAVGVDVPQVQVPGDGGRRGINAVDRRGGIAVEVEDAAFLPEALPARLRCLRVVMLGQYHGSPPIVSDRNANAPSIPGTEGALRGTTLLRRHSSGALCRPPARALAITGEPVTVYRRLKAKPCGRVQPFNSRATSAIGSVAGFQPMTHLSGTEP